MTSGAAERDIALAHTPQLADPVVLQAPTEVVVQRSTEDIVREYFADIPVMIDIAYCESKFTHYLPSGSTLRGRMVHTDLGVMQINEYFHGAAAARLGLNLHTLEDNLAYARYLYLREGTRPWYPSQACWSRRVAQR